MRLALGFGFSRARSSMLPPGRGELCHHRQSTPWYCARARPLSPTSALPPLGRVASRKQGPCLHVSFLISHGRGSRRWVTSAPSVRAWTALSQRHTAPLSLQCPSYPWASEQTNPKHLPSHLLLRHHRTSGAAEPVPDCEVSERFRTFVICHLVPRTLPRAPTVRSSR